MKVQNFVTFPVHSRFKFGADVPLLPNGDIAHARRLLPRSAVFALQHVDCNGGSTSGSVITLDQVQPRSNLHVVSNVGARLPIYCTSQGKVFLAHMKAADAQKLLQRQTFVSFTPHTITDIPTLLQKLSECREAGYAIENGEYKIGLCSISAPVFTRDGTVAYTTGVIGMFCSIHCDEFAAAVEQVRATASMISAALGYRLDRAT